MPTYDYRCTKCGHAFEAFQRMTEARLSRCPKCKGRVKRLIGKGAGIIFKGSGFYETDYRRKSDKGVADKEAAAGSSSSVKPKSSDGDKPKSSDGEKKKASCEAAK